MAVVFFWLWQRLLPLTTTMVCATHMLLFCSIFLTPLRVSQSQQPSLTIPLSGCPFAGGIWWRCLEFILFVYRPSMCVIIALFLPMSLIFLPITNVVVSLSSGQLVWSIDYSASFKWVLSYSIFMCRVGFSSSRCRCLRLLNMLHSSSLVDSVNSRGRIPL